MPSDPAQSPSRRPRHAWAWLFIISCAAGLAFVFFVVLGCLRVGADVRIARDHAIHAFAPAGNWSKQVELSLGAAVLPLVRSATAFLDLPPEARACLAATRRVEVGVYRLRSLATAGAARGCVADMSADMRRRGWTCTVSVRTPTETVCLYTREDVGASGVVSLCAVVCTGEDLVIASGRVDPAPLLPLVRDHLEGARPIRLARVVDRI